MDNHVSASYFAVASFLMKGREASSSVVTCDAQITRRTFCQ